MVNGALPQGARSVHRQARSRRVLLGWQHHQLSGGHARRRSPGGRSVLRRGGRDGRSPEHQGAAADPVRRERRAHQHAVARLRGGAEGERRPVRDAHVSRNPARLSQQLDAALPRGVGKARLGANDRLLQEEPGGPGMIVKFGSLFAGHVDLDNEGFDGTPANDRWLPDERLAEVFPKSEAIAKLMDRTGYDTFWLAEHHFQREGYECIPNILMLALHLCHITKNIKIGCGFNIAPMWHPLRMAEDYTTADWLTGGRVVFASGAAITRARSKCFGARSRPGRQPRALRGAGRTHLQIVQRACVLAPGQVLHDSAAPGAVSRLRAAEISRWCRARRRCPSSAGSSGQRERPGARLHGQHNIKESSAAALQGGANEKVVHAFREARARAGRRPSWVAISASARSTSPTARSRASRRRRRSSRRTSRCSPPASACRA